MNLEKFVQWLQQLQLDAIWETLVIVVASLFCIMVHETCHGLAAYWMGDDTAKNAGRLTLNPVKHVDIVGLVMMALVHFGWAKPVPVDMRKFKNPKAGMAVTALAGPVSNVLLSLAALVLRAVVLVFYYKYPSQGAWEWIVFFLEYVAILSAGLAVFNLFPVPPLDGSKVLFSFLPQRIYNKLMRYEKYGMLVLAALLLTGLLDKPLLFLRTGLINGLNAVAGPLFYYLAERLL